MFTVRDHELYRRYTTQTGTYCYHLIFCSGSPLVSFCWRSSAKLSNHYFFFCPFFCSSSAAKGTQCGIHTGRTELCFIKGDNFDESGIIVEAAAAKTWPSDFSLRKL